MLINNYIWNLNLKNVTYKLIYYTIIVNCGIVMVLLFTTI